MGLFYYLVTMLGLITLSQMGRLGFVLPTITRWEAVLHNNNKKLGSTDLNVTLFK